MNLLFLTAAFLISNFISPVFGVADTIGCRDENGNLVDWFYVYKLPKNLNGSNGSGLNYLFTTPSSFEWILSQKLINNSDSMLGMTLGEAYKNKNGTDNKIKMMYNDEPPNGQANEKRGHTKGVVVANDINGFWLIHSVPKFPPPIEEKYGYPDSGQIYAQSFLCISLFADKFWAVAQQLKFNEPNFYSSHVPPKLRWIFPELVDALKMNPITTPPFFNVATIESRKKVKFTSFAKSANFQKELYEDLVAPHFSAGNYYVESWRHGTGNIDSDCSKPSKVYNIEKICFKSQNISFDTLQDHSKWMSNREESLICVGDINRQEHQKLRGGGTVCQKSKISEAYANLICEFEECKQNQRCLTPETHNMIEELDLKYSEVFLTD